jgi:hypothetical protein
MFTVAIIFSRGVYFFTLTIKHENGDKRDFSQNDACESVALNGHYMTPY